MTKNQRHLQKLLGYINLLPPTPPYLVHPSAWSDLVRLAGIGRDGGVESLVEGRGALDTSGGLRSEAPGAVEHS